MKHARVEQQRVMIPNVISWMQWRAVCDEHRSESDDRVAAWMAPKLHNAHILAVLDAVAHDMEMHANERMEQTWDEILAPRDEPDDPPLLPHALTRARHAVA